MGCFSQGTPRCCDDAFCKGVCCLSLCGCPSIRLGQGTAPIARIRVRPPVPELSALVFTARLYVHLTRLYTAHVMVVHCSCHGRSQVCINRAGSVSANRRLSTFYKRCDCFGTDGAGTAGTLPLLRSPHFSKIENCKETISPVACEPTVGA